MQSRGVAPKANSGRRRASAARERRRRGAGSQRAVPEGPILTESSRVAPQERGIWDFREDQRRSDLFYVGRQARHRGHRPGQVGEASRLERGEPARKVITR